MYLEQQTFSTCVSDFLIDREIRHLSPKSILIYKQELSTFERFIERKGLSDKSINSFTSVILRQWFSELGTHRNTGGVASNYRIMKCLFNWVDSEYELEWKNPIIKVKVPNTKNEPIAPIPIEDVQLLLNSCSGEFEMRDKCILKFLIDSGLRASELLALNIADVNLETGQVKVLHGKGNKMRIVWIGEKTIKAVKAMLSDEETTLGSRPLFLNKKGLRIQFFGLRQLIHKLCRRAKIKMWGIHCFRRSFAINMMRNGCSVQEISRLLGHSSLLVTMRYLCITNEDLQSAHKRASPADLLE